MQWKLLLGSFRESTIWCCYNVASCLPKCWQWRILRLPVRGRHRVPVLSLSLWFMFCLNPLRPRQNGRHFADDTIKRIFWNQNVRNAIKISLKFVPKGRIHNIPWLVQIMAWCRPGDKPLSEPMMVRLQTHICITRPQWVNHCSDVWKIM